MSTKSSQGPHHPKQIFSKKMIVVAIIIGVVFITTILVYPRIFNPSNIGKDTSNLSLKAEAPAPVPVSH